MIAEPLLILREGSAWLDRFPALAPLRMGTTMAAILASVPVRQHAELHYALERLRQANLLHYRLPLAAGSVLVEPLRAGFRWPTATAAPAESVLSRFAYLRREGGDMLLESPLAAVKIVLQGDAIEMVLAFLLRGAAGFEAVRTLLFETGFLVDCDASEPEPLVTWEFHDLLFHRASSWGDAAGAVGRTQRFTGQISQPAVEKPPSGDPLLLPRPDEAALEACDPPLARVTAARRSLRQPGELPLSLGQLGEFLWRVARVPRPLPAAGGLHELEFYAIVDRAGGLAPGLYHYRGSTHALYRLRDAAETTCLLDHAQAMCRPEEQRPQVLIAVAARFARMAWSYQGIAYRNVLLDVGVALHAMYLAATAMNLAPCALGWNDPDQFARAAGLDPRVESSVAFFTLSSSSAAEP